MFPKSCSLFLALSCLVSISPVTAAPSTDDMLKSARMHRDMFDDAESIKDYSTYLKKRPNDEAVRLERANQLRIEHRLDEAAADYRILTHSKVKRTAISAATELGKLLQAQGKYKDAIEVFKYARSLGASTLLMEMSECALAMGDATNALLYANAMLPKEQVPGHETRARAYMGLKQYDKALEEYNQLVKYHHNKLMHTDRESHEALEVMKKHHKILMERADCYVALKQPKLAEADRKTAMKSEREMYNESPFITRDK